MSINIKHLLMGVFWASVGIASVFAIITIGAWVITVAFPNADRSLHTDNAGVICSMFAFATLAVAALFYAFRHAWQYFCSYVKSATDRPQTNNKGRA